MRSWNGTIRKKKVMPTTLKTELILWNLTANSENQLNVIFFDPIASGLLEEMNQDDLW